MTRGCWDLARLEKSTGNGFLCSFVESHFDFSYLDRAAKGAVPGL